MRDLRMSAGLLPTVAGVLFICSFNVSGCERTEEIADPVAESSESPWHFPGFFLEKGTDADSSYISLRGVLKNGGVLELQATSWGIRETGLFLARQKTKRAAIFVFMGECGTVTTRTWEKTTLFYELTAADQDTVDRVLYTNHRDTLEIARTRAF